MKILKILKSNKMRIFNIWSWPSAFIDDIRQWLMVRKALREAEVVSAFKNFKYELRIDRIGRVYTVINVPEELWEYEKREMVWPWMVEQLRELDDVLMRVRLNELLYPEVTPIEGSPAYLVVLSTSSESISIWKFLRWILNLSFVLLGLFIINKLVIKYAGSSIIHLIYSLF